MKTIKLDTMGLVAAIVQHFETDKVLMLGYMNEESINMIDYLDPKIIDDVKVLTEQELEDYNREEVHDIFSSEIQKH